MRPTTGIVRRRSAVAVLLLTAVAPAISACSQADYERPATATAAAEQQDTARRARPPGEVARPQADLKVETPHGSQTRSPAGGVDGSASGQDALDLLSTPATSARLEAVRKDFDARQDGWESEAVSEQANLQLKQIAKLLTHPEKLTADALDNVAAPDFSADPLRPALRQEVFRDAAVTVFHARDPSPADAPDSAETHRGAPRLAAALRELAAGLKGTSQVKVKFKLFRIEPKQGQSVTTTAYYLASGHTEGGSIQQNATWTCHWLRGSGEGPPRLSSIAVSDYEEVVVRSPSETLFADCTQAVLGQDPAFRQQLSLGVDDWRDRLEESLHIYFSGHQGLAVGDVNGDSLEDVYVCQPGGLPNRMFVQQADGTLQDASQHSRTAILDFTRSALLVDLDNDGDQDLVVSASGMMLFHANDGSGRFRGISWVSVGRPACSLAAADYDQDGDLDIYACEYYAPAEDQGDLAVPFPYQDANNGGGNVLLRNDGNWKFRDVTAETGLGENNRRFSFAAAWEDYDNDGDLDLYVANDFGRNNLYRNEGGKFRDVAVETGAVDQNFGMSVTWGDYNHDGWMDLYVSNMFSAAGNRITFQPQFKQDASAETKSVLQRLARGNTLLANAGDGTFRDASLEAGVTMGRWSWASLFADINNDGWQDLIVANGYITGKDPHDL